MGIRDRLRRLERRFRGWGPNLEEVGTAFGRMARCAKMKLCSEAVDEEQRARDHDTIRSWQQAEGVDLDTEAELSAAMRTDGHDPAPIREAMSG